MHKQKNTLSSKSNFRTKNRNLEFQVRKGDEKEFKVKGKKNVYKLDDFEFVNNVRNELPIPDLEGGKIETVIEGTKKAKENPWDKKKEGEGEEEPIPVPLHNEEADNEEYEREGGFKLTVYYFLLKKLKVRSYCNFDYKIEWYFKDDEGNVEKVPFRFFEGNIKKNNMKTFGVHYQELLENDKILIRLTSKINGTDVKCKYCCYHIFR